MVDFYADILPVLLSCTGPGALGGVGTFLFSVKMGHYRNNRFATKFVIEVFGAVVVASFVGPILPKTMQIFLSFAVGLAWASIVQTVRQKITRMVEAALSK